jgi:acetyltransferase-like isoleucine patch superfamily enzyme
LNLFDYKSVFEKTKMIVGINVNISPHAVIYDPDKLEIGEHVRIDDFCVLSCGGGLKIGNYVHIACYTALFAGAGIIIKDFSGLSSHCAVYSVSDDYSGESLTNPTIPDKYKKLHRGLVTLEKHVIIGSGVTIMPGVTLGEGAAVGANSLVTKDCDPWGIYAGTPVRRIKERSKNLLRVERDFLDGAKRL